MVKFIMRVKNKFYLQKCDLPRKLTTWKHDI